MAGQKRRRTGQHPLDFPYSLHTGNDAFMYKFISKNRPVSDPLIDNPAFGRISRSTDHVDGALTRIDYPR